MGTNSDFRGLAEDGGALQTIRTALAYSVLMVGLTGTAAAVPVFIWALAKHGLR